MPKEAERTRPGVDRPASAPALAAAISPHANGAVLSVVVTPRSGVTAFGPVEGDAVRLRVAAAPVDGAANAALIRFLAASAGVPRSAVRLLAGESGRHKRILVEGVRPEELARRLTAGA
jgi:uncharacterized protein YggU (UPF0235/DUF167 family)